MGKKKRFPLYLPEKIFSEVENLIESGYFPDKTSLFQEAFQFYVERVEKSFGNV